MDAEPPTPLPPTAPAATPPRDHTALLQSFLAAGFSLRRLARDANLTAAELVAFADDPEILAKLESLARLAAAARPLAHAEAESVARDTLASVAETSQDPVECRRAAGALSRLIRPAAPQRPTDPAPDSSLPSPDSPAPSPKRPRPRRLPHPSLQPDQVLPVLLDALKHNDHPTPNCGLATLHAFLTDDARAATPYVEELIDRATPDLAPLLNHTAAEVAAPHFHDNHTASQDIAITPASTEPRAQARSLPPPLSSDPNDPVAADTPVTSERPPIASAAHHPQTLIPFRAHLRKATRGKRYGCWLIHAIEPLDTG